MSRQTAGSRMTKKRQLIRKDQRAQIPFVPWGLVPALGLGLVFLFGLIPFPVAWIQHTARSTAENALMAAGANWADVTASGQQITLSGQAPDEAAIRTAKQAIREGTNRTPFGFMARPVTTIHTKATVAGNPAYGAATTPHDWAYTLDRSVLELNGDVPDQATRAAIIDATRAATISADQRPNSPRVSSINDNLNITGRVADPGFTQTALRGISALSRCDAGTASFTQGVFSLNCEAQQVSAEDIKEFASAPLAYGKIGRIDVYSAEAVDACNQSMIGLLSNTRIEFSSSSAIIEPESAPLLDRVALAAEACPGNLRIEGHTDTSGRSALNDRLSRQRAQAVRLALIERGIDPTRLTATGFGASRPIADNATGAGRARNRRIEIKVARGGD